MSAIITDGPKVLADNRLVNIRRNFKLAKDPTSELLSEITSPAGSLLAVKLHSENGVIFKGKYEILISLILQWQDNPRKTM